MAICFNDEYCLVFKNPETGGEVTLKLWEIKPKGAAKVLDVKGGWWQANDERLIFSIRKFDPMPLHAKRN